MKKKTSSSQKKCHLQGLSFKKIFFFIANGHFKNSFSCYLRPLQQKNFACKTIIFYPGVNRFYGLNTRTETKGDIRCRVPEGDIVEEIPTIFPLY